MPFPQANFDVDGVLVDAPYERACREALPRLTGDEWRDVRDRASWTADRFTSKSQRRAMRGQQS